ncbi:O-antigen ligase family protein [Zobellia sp. 1_MG-2023]|uniref:O-antigen ligase family protein n=1 Tax=Zobellia sp. 1_MG-2023 TaxID=3062626 RepID=UPI0026E318C8|nr:O-antigen ligase family protein [Zobellia sp. 1_MG-2023]MDO6819741.1 hypothetical protein [Zobellia sp. 1_MG-2023]
MRAAIILCFYFPLVTNLLNVQAFISNFLSATIAQIFAYGNLMLLIIGVLIIIRQTKPFTPLIKLWFAFYIFYYSIALFANVLLDTTPPILKTLVPVVYFVSFSFLLSIPSQIKKVSKILAISFFVSSVFIILFNYFNFSLDHDGVYEYKLERAGGLYGDANNACIVAILAFIFIKSIITTKTNGQVILKVIALFITSYAVIITFSKTGFVVFLLILSLLYRHLFTVQRLLLSIIFIPLFLYAAITWAISSDNLSRIQKERVESIVNIITLNTDKVGLSDRDILFKNMLSFIQENPYIGNGINFSNIIRGHNTIFGVWADAGILVFLLFLFLIFSFFKKAIFSENSLKYFGVAILTTLTIFMMTLQTIINQGYLMVLFSLLSFIFYKTKGDIKNIMYN